MREQFDSAMRAIFAAAECSGFTHIDVLSKGLHVAIGGYPKVNRMPVCCDSMYSFVGDGDEVLKAPSKGKGATLLIRYKITRSGGCKTK